MFNALCNRILESKNRMNAKLSLNQLLHDSSDGLLREWIGLNKLYVHVSLYTIDLESKSGPAPGMHDPLSRGLSVDTAFHVSGITTSVSTRDVFQALARGNESEEEMIRELKYEIIWVDDVSFFVGTRAADDDVNEYGSATTSLIVSHVKNNLYDGLGSGLEITSLGDYFMKKHSNAAEPSTESGGIVGSLVSVATLPFKAIGGVLGFGRKRSSDASDSGNNGANKRRRLG